MCKTIMAHCLNWRVEDIKNNLSRFANQGFNAILTSVLQDSKRNENNTDWYWCYQNLGFNIGGYLGNKEDIRNLCEEAKKYNIKIYIDTVINHVGSDEHNNLKYHKDVTIPKEWQMETGMTYNYDNRWEATMTQPGLPHLKYWLPEVQKSIFKMYDEYVSLGCSGFRIDELKHIQLDYEFVQDNLLSKLKERYVDKGIDIFGEVIFCSNDLIKRYSNFVGVYTNSWTDCTNVFCCPLSHDEYYNFGQNPNNNEIIAKYADCVHSDKRGVVFFIKPFDNLWQDERIKFINTQY